jgi:hypothetical protein
LAEGDVLFRGRYRLEVLWGPISGGARWGTDKLRVWARNTDTDDEGFAVFDADEAVLVDGA